MLLSPSHSPRRLSSLSPSVSESPAHQTPGSSNSLITPTSTNPRKRNPSTLLDEDTYVAAIEKIIQRDFFPDVPKLRDRLDWLEATRTGDSGVESTRTSQMSIFVGTICCDHKLPVGLNHNPGNVDPVVSFAFNSLPYLYGLVMNMAAMLMPYLFVIL
ncbi:hypothetical protein E3N88_13396 [Mikania micrantha]|uniref:Uncharacterized protein n=1 Tax=Mikania micrantha TaxID=192012 RepID=A0A5N6PAS4_9ASTR|nr:hypothetical protein E3N88_13396 [Mikania micrantha]